MKLLLPILLLLAPIVNLAATFTIADGDVNALAAAISASNANNEPDVINLAPGGMYILTSVRYTSSSVSRSGFSGERGLPAIAGDVVGLDLTINGNNSTLSRDLSAPLFGLLSTRSRADVIINNLRFSNGLVNAQGAGLFVEFKSTTELNYCVFTNNESTLNVEGGGGAVYAKSLNLLRINNCIFENNRAVNQGGALNVLLSDLYLTGSRFSNNSTTGTTGDEQGGAIYNDGARGDNGEFIVRNCLFEGNTTFYQGGALFTYPYNNNSYEVIDCIFNNNQTSTTTGNGGGFFFRSSRVTIGDADYPYTSIPANSTLTFKDCIFDGNVSRQGGGVWLDDGRLTEPVSNCTFRNNTSITQGGGVALSTNRPVVFSSCTFNGNRSNQGGGIALSGASQSVDIINCTLEGNIANQYGGAIVAPKNGIIINITNCTIANNQANNPTNGQGGAIFSGGNGGINQSLTIKNNIFYNNTVSNRYGGGGDPSWRHCNCQMADGGNNIFFPEKILPNITGNTCVANPVILDAKANALADNGGVTQTMSLRSDSPAIDAGTSLGAPADDQRGIQRVGRIDIGAYEFEGAMPVKLASFEIEKEGMAALLKWRTSEEYGVSHYEVERSIGSVSSFKVIKKISANNKPSSYNFVDSDLVPLQKNYDVFYRLRVIDHDQTYTYSKIRQIGFDGSFEGAPITLFPNPASNTVNIKSEIGSIISFKIHNATGKLVMQGSGSNAEEVNIDIHTLPVDIYLIETTTLSAKKTIRLVKIR
ncbi:T9SS type A sorting domain-containing protein [Dyadobacter sp. CY343]|uniref:T9SS type A sorting domain-containing protein n=1 Tax=Dyadobacter sp. CY343 TaxID=2907299 RepID=UPI001F2A324E|nr:T9SS type A sorting domain-containing protein [Dyadobacter sp. CY343]MCE7059702.1 T9SS type A sorting domain-containing protein [Dyadobacter sp. CY343]